MKAIRTASVIFSGLLLIFVLVGVQAEEQSVETSIVSLILKNDQEAVAKDPLFELIDKEDYILLPLNRLSSKLAYELNFRRSDNRMTVRSLQSGKTAEIDLNSKTYLIDGQFAWANQPPIIMENEIYVTPKLLEYISGVTIIWDTKYQELIIIASWFKRMAGEKTGETGENVSDETTSEPILEGPAFSLGSIRYDLGGEFRNDPDTGNEFGSIGLMRLDGRAGDWSWSLAGEWDTNPVQDEDIFENGISLIRAKYNKNKQLIILGDSDLYFERFFNTQWDVRGALYMYPNDQPFRKESAFTSVSGPAKPGDKVALIVNGRPYGKIEVKGDFYLFPRVPLRVQRVNIIKVVIENKSGEKTVTERRVAGSPYVYEAKTHEIMATVGQFRPSTELKYGDLIGGVKVHQSFSDNFSTSLEVAELKMDEDGKVIYNGDLGVAFRLGSSLIASMDWLGSGEQPIHSGYEGSLMYCFTKGFVEGKTFLLHPSFYDWLQTSYDEDEDVYAVSGKGWGIDSEYEPNERWKFGFDSILSNALPDTDEPSYKDYWLRSTRYFGENLEDSLIAKLHKKDLSGIDYVGEHYDQGLQSLSVEYNYYGEDISGSILGLYSSVMTQPQFSPEYKNDAFLTELSCIKMFGKNIIYDADLIARQDWRDQTDFQSYHLETGLKWIRDNTWYTGYIKVKADDYDGEGMSVSESEAGAGVRWVLADGYSFWGVQASSVQMDYMDDTYFTGNVEALYRINRSDSYFKGHIEYISPVGNRDAPQLEMELGLEYYFSSGLGLEASFERVYDSIYDNEPDMVFKVMIDQSILFAKNHRRTAKYSEEDELSSVFGTVYLDENGNGHYDFGEKRISGLKMMLNERRLISDKNGDYLFINIDPGVYMLGFDMRTLSADYSPVTENVLIRVRENENMAFDFGVTVNGTIAGKVFVDVNANGKLDPADQPLNWVGISLDGGKAKAFSDRHGEFLFEKVPLGPHKVEILKETVPSGMMFASATSYNIDLTVDSFDKSDLVFLVKYKFTD